MEMFGAEIDRARNVAQRRMLDGMIIEKLEGGQKPVVGEVRLGTLPAEGPGVSVNPTSSISMAWTLKASVTERSCMRRSIKRQTGVQRAVTVLLKRWTFESEPNRTSSSDDWSRKWSQSMIISDDVP